MYLGSSQFRYVTILHYYWTREIHQKRRYGPDVGTVEIRFTGFDFPNVETPRDLHGRYYALPIYYIQTHIGTYKYIICNVYVFALVLQYIIITFSSSCTPCAHANYTTAINTFQLLRDHISPESRAHLTLQLPNSIYFYHRHIYIYIIITSLMFIHLLVPLLSIYYYHYYFFQSPSTYVSQLSVYIWICKCVYIDT